MAGIGFQLKKLVNKEKIYGGIRAFVYSSVIISGPLILCIVQLLIAQKFLVIFGAQFFERELLIAGIMYSFVFSQVITSGFFMVITRYVSDQIYCKKEGNIMPSLYGAIALILVIGGLISITFYSYSSLGMIFKIPAYLLFIELLILNILAIYISAVKKYMNIVKAYGVGAITAIFTMWICFLVLDTLKAEHLLVCMVAGFLVSIVYLIRSIKRQFPETNNNSFDFLSYIQKYPSLFFIGLFYVIGLFGHIFIVWGSDRQERIGDTFIIAPFYDVPYFYAFLSVLPAMIMFVVSMETSFFKLYKKYYENVTGEYPLWQINEIKSKMLHVLKYELVKIMRFQLIFTILAIFFGTTIIPLSIEQRGIFNILVIGNYFFIIMYVIMQILLYFDDRKGVVIVISTYMSVSLLSMANTVIFEGNYGLPSFLSGIIGLLIAILRLFHYMKNIEYYTFCYQPLFTVHKNSFMERIAHRMNELNRGGRGN